MPHTRPSRDVRAVQYIRSVEQATTTAAADDEAVELLLELRALSDEDRALVRQVAKRLADLRK